jgi:hypothetical protein
LTYDGLTYQYKYFYKKNTFQNSENDAIPEGDKAFIRNMLTKPWSLYVFRHSALTEKSFILKEHVLRDYTGWSMSSKMPQVYIHYFGTVSSKSLLEEKGIINKKDADKFNILKTKSCPNCQEPNKPDARFCNKCNMVLSYDSYIEIRSEDKNKIEKLENDMESLKEGMSQIFLLIQQNPLLINIKPEVLHNIHIKD